MMPELLELGLILGLAGYAAYRFQALRVRELALQAARRACRQHGLQLLDESVSIRRLSLSRDRRGNWRIWRQYRFEYSRDGEQRVIGQVIMLGTQLTGLALEGGALPPHSQGA